MKKENIKYKFADLFAGIGGFHYAIKKIEKNSKPVLVSEIDKWSKKSYINNHKYKGEIKNIREIHASDIEDFNVLFGGFPCQTFSNAGKKTGFLDKTRGTLFFEIVRLLKVKKAKFLLLENVKHLVKHDDGKTWEVIRNALVEIGYIVPKNPILLSPHQFGIPQIRWRVFIPAIFDEGEGISESDLNFNFKDQFKEEPKKLKLDKEPEDYALLNDKKIKKSIDAWSKFIMNVKRPKDRTLPVIWLDYMNNKKVDTKSMPNWKKKYIIDMRNVYRDNKVFIDNWMKEHNTNKWGKRERKLEWQAGKNEFDIKKTYLQLRQSGMRFKKDNIFPTLVAMVQTSLVYDKDRWRYLTKNEVRKLQSFPDSFKFNDMPDHQTYKQFGNSVNVNVVKRVLEKLLKVGENVKS